MKPHNEMKARNSSGSPIYLRTRVNRGVMWPTIRAIHKAFKMGFPVNNEDRLE
jgi:hypothetical protein